MTLTQQEKKPRCLIESSSVTAGLQEKRDYFNYVTAIKSVIELLNEQYGGQFQIYSEDNNSDVWSSLEDDIRSGYSGIEHAASIYDLVETREFRFVVDAEPEQSGYDIRLATRNNVFVYPEYRVAFARVPVMQHYGLGYEDVIFSENDDGLTRCLNAMRKRQLANRQIVVFTDTSDGLERQREKSTGVMSRDDVFMDESLKTQIYRSVDEFFSKDRAFFQTYGIPYKRGVLLYGKPGNGKTTLVKSIASTVEAPIAYWQITEYTSSGSIREVFQAAVNMAPMVLVIEDIDSMPASCRSFFLNTLDGATSKEGVFLIGTTNYPERIDPALMNRAGRFDRAYEVKLPDEATRYAYMIRRGMGRLVDESVIAQAARQTEGFSLAQLSELYVSAALQQHYDHTVDLQGLIGEMKSDYSKSRSGDWMADPSIRRVGFA
ncbi:AAA family ATPase [Paenibacillus xylaniclasticus]|uniref:AAA family ATPase n=1 Tax=Paenibacillus xylaniclasticus TaxID=588083 RepID=UPI000FDA1BA4|nr:MULTISPECIES: ATP-binding protein [Paenibacillus]GFN31485.1 putative ATPase YjoB [Paenibacillus curdlanolyticus]